MSSALAIASVTHVLKEVLNGGLIENDVAGIVGGTVSVSALPPDRIDTGDTEDRQLNLFMYQATYNQAWRNFGLPSLNAQGERISNPPLALDLHYLLTAYGPNEFQQEILLGHGMLQIHENPILTREMIRESLSPPINPAALGTSGLADQVEQITISPESLNMEELSRLWTAFGSKYRPHAAYRVTVVLIESRKPTKTALPVQQRKIYVRPFKQPFIEKLLFENTNGTPLKDTEKILAGYQMTIKGMQLKGEIVNVKVGTTEIGQGDFLELDDQQIIFSLPTDLAAGIHAVQVVHQIPMGIDTPPQPHKGFSSNIEAFVLSPTLVSVDFTDPTTDPDGLLSGNIEIEITPGLEQAQQLLLLLNQLGPAGTTPAEYSFQLSIPTAPNEGPTGTEITIPITGVRSGTYLARIQIDGTESPLNSDYNGPTVSIT